MKLLRTWGIACFAVVASAALAVAAEAPKREQEQDQTELLAQLEAYAKKAQQQWSVPGLAIAVVKDDQVVYAKGFGVKSVRGSEPVGPDTVFQIGSTSKAFTAALVAQQVDAKKFGWSDRVVDHLPAFEMNDPWVTREFQVADLMAQHSGMPAYAGDGMAMLGYPADRIVANIRRIEPVSSFRAEFAYVNNLFLVAADLTTAVSSQSWADGLSSNLFEPLGMRSSSSGQSAFEAAADKATAHKIVGGKVTTFPPDAPELAWAYTYGPAGGINSTVHDMAQWLRLLLGSGTFEGKEIISAENLQAVMSPRTVIHFPKTGPLASTPLFRFQNFYCNGWISTVASPRTLVWHNGDNNFMHAAIGVLADDRTGIVILTNLGGASLADALLWRWFDLVGGNPETDWSTVFYESWSDMQKAGQEKFRAPVADPSPAQDLADYTGTFQNPVYGEIRVEEADGGLRLVAGPAKLTMKLVHRTHDAFVVSQSEIDAFLGDSGTATFAFGDDGKVASVALSEFGDVDGGRFTVVPPK